jgi:hypothetical protein
MKRVVIFLNGTQIDGKVFIIYLLFIYFYQYLRN